MTTPKAMTKVLIFGGKTGWIGGMMHAMCKEKGNVFFFLFVGITAACSSRTL
jgi:hypothetical protein